MYSAQRNSSTTTSSGGRLKKRARRAFLSFGFSSSLLAIDPLRRPTLPGPLDFREVDVERDVLPQTYGSARVVVGGGLGRGTEVLCAVTASVGEAVGGACGDVEVLAEWSPATRDREQWAAWAIENILKKANNDVEIMKCPLGSLENKTTKYWGVGLRAASVKRSRSRRSRRASSHASSIG